jgi:uncharacterized protein YmfQ (DUF2313 family)
MATDRKLIDYLPPFIQKFFQIQHIMSAEQPEVDALWNECENVLNESFIMYANESGIKRWEGIVGITPKDTDTLDERRFRILTKMNQELPYTITKLQEVLTTICGAGNFSINLQPNVYHIEVRLALANKNNYNDVVDVLKKMIPANMTQWVQIMYNSHRVVGKFTHAELTSYTHEQLRNEVFTNG